jgi:hypothetical protein
VNDKDRENAVCPGRQWHSHLDFSALHRCPPIYESEPIIYFLYEKSDDPFLRIRGVFILVAQESPRRRQQAVPEVIEAVLREERKNPAIKAELIGAFEGKPSNGTSV